jgi:two-component system OmpR family sensor kinase
MIQPKQRRYLLPAALGLMGLLLLVRLFLINNSVLVPEDTDIIFLVVFLSIAMVTAIHTIVRISMGYLRSLSVQRARRETLAEHSRFLLRLDHELKNPLTTLRAGLSTLSLTALDEQQRQMVETMKQETTRLSRLVADLRKLAELDVQPLNLVPVNIEAFIDNLVQIERERFEAGGRTFTSEVETAEKSWLADEDLLALAVHNLLDNAYKYTRPGDAVQLKVVIQQEMLIQVSDSGAGIAETALPLIWEELYRVEQQQKIPGSGIGLALVKAIVERHDGTVEIGSKPGQGTAVSLHLPPLKMASN